MNSVIENIENNLLKSYYLNYDESQIKIDGNGYNISCVCNKKYTRFCVHEYKSKEALDDVMTI